MYGNCIHHGACMAYKITLLIIPLDMNFKLQYTQDQGGEVIPGSGILVPNDSYELTKIVTLDMNPSSLCYTFRSSISYL